MSVEVDTSKLNRILRSVDGDMADVVATVGFAIERVAKTLAPVDTGALHDSIYTKTKAGGRQPSQRAGVVYVDLPEPHSQLQVIVGPTVSYGIFLELGTGTQAAQPYLTPAVEQVTRDLDRHIRTGSRRALEGR